MPVDRDHHVEAGGRRPARRSMAEMVRRQRLDPAAARAGHAQVDRAAVQRDAIPGQHLQQATGQLRGGHGQAARTRERGLDVDLVGELRQTQPPAAAVGADDGEHGHPLRLAGVPEPAMQYALLPLGIAIRRPLHEALGPQDGADVERAAEQRRAAPPHVDIPPTAPACGQPVGDQPAVEMDVVGPGLAEGIRAVDQQAAGPGQPAPAGPHRGACDLAHHRGHRRVGRVP